MSAEPPRRLRAADVIDNQAALLMAQATRPHAEPTSDVEINRSTTNGRYGFKVSVTAREAHEAKLIAMEIVSELEKAYPYEENLTDKLKASVEAERKRAQIAARKGRGE